MNSANLTGNILIVDDETPNLQLLREILSGAGHQVRPAKVPQLAIESARAQPPDLILLDIIMPEMNGFEVCRCLKEDAHTRDIPIIFVSALQDVAEKVRGFKMGGVDFITKPFEESEVLARVNNHLALHKLTMQLEDRVAQRTKQLASSNQALKIEIEERVQAEKARQQYHDRLRALAYDLTITEERERRRIAEELHDGPVQVLAFARMRLSSARKEPDAAKRDRALDEVSESLRQATLASSMLVSDLSSPALQELGLAEAISDWAGVFMKSQFGIKTSVINRLEQADTNLLDDPIRAILFRNIREILVNVIKHSQASHVDVFLERNDDKLVVTVRDDGTGCDSSEADQGVNKDSGFGLFSIRERMADLGGALEVESQAGEGYTARLVMPL